VFSVSKWGVFSNVEKFSVDRYKFQWWSGVGQQCGWGPFSIIQIHAAHVFPSVIGYWSVWCKKFSLMSLRLSSSLDSHFENYTLHIDTFCYLRPLFLSMTENQDSKYERLCEKVDSLVESVQLLISKRSAEIVSENTRGPICIFRALYFVLILLF
jgi:hypothetical protein